MSCKLNTEYATRAKNQKVATPMQPALPSRTNPSIIFARWRQCAPSSNTWLIGPTLVCTCKRHLDLLIRLCTVHGRDEHTYRLADTQTDSAMPPAAIGRIYVMYSMRPKAFGIKNRVRFLSSSCTAKTAQITSAAKCRTRNTATYCVYTSSEREGGGRGRD